VESVYIMKRVMRFSLKSFEKRYLDYWEDSLRVKLIAPAIVLSAYSIYSLFSSDWFHSAQYLSNWSTAPNILYNLTWLSFILMGIIALFVGIRRTVFVHSVETFFQYWALYVLVTGILFGNRWRVCKICGVEYNDSFDAWTDKYPEVDLIMLLVGVVIYLSVYAEFRLRRLVWVVLIAFVIYSGTAIGFGVPLPVMQTDGKVSLDSDRSEAIFLSVSLFLLFAVSLLGKFTLELLQRRNFLDLELATKRIDVLEKTINAIDDNNQPHTQLEQTHRRLKDAERIIEKVRLMNNASTGASCAQELETALALIRKTERNMTMLDFHKEVLLGPIKTGIEWKQEEVVKWIETVVNPGRNLGGPSRNKSTGSAFGGIRATPSETSINAKPAAWKNHPRHSPRGGHRLSHGGHRPSTLGEDDDLGISAKALMKQIGYEWNLSVTELETTLHENRATELSAIHLVSRALLAPVAKDTLNIGLDVVKNFAQAVEDMYLDVPFHNGHHAAQVCHHVNVLAYMSGVSHYVSRLDLVALTVAGLCHDISHFGRSNAFLVETRHELATRYNDSSVLENFHAATTFKAITSSKATDITSGLSRRDERRFRSRLIQLILATDTSTHFQVVAELRMRLLGKNLFQEPQLEETDRRVVLSVLLRAADLGYHAMPLDIHTQWAERLAEEYAEQGDDERALGLTVSPMCDRASQDIPSMEIGMMNLVVMPLYDELFNLVRIQNQVALNTFGVICGQLVSNHTHWTMVRQNRERTINPDHPFTETAEFDRMSDGSELYIPAPPAASFGPNSPFDGIRKDDLIQRVYSSELLARTHSAGSLGLTQPPQPPPAPLSPRSQDSAVSLTYSQAHGYENDPYAGENDDDYT
jgi:hypothetical protein